MKIIVDFLLIFWIPLLVGFLFFLLYVLFLWLADFIYNKLETEKEKEEKNKIAENKEKKEENSKKDLEKTKDEEKEDVSKK